MRSRGQYAHEFHSPEFVASLRKNRANVLRSRRARKVQKVRHQPAKHQLKTEPEKEVFSVQGHLTFLANIVQYYENSPNKQFKRPEKRPKDIWQGACLDAGAQRIVIGERQARAYCKYVGCKFKLQASRTVFRFGVDRQKSLGILSIRVPVPDGSMMVLNVDVVPVDVPFLIGLDILDKFKLIVNTVDNTLDSRLAGWSIPLDRKIGHIYLPWLKEHKVMFTKTELLKLHRGFHHPAAKRLLALLKRAKVKDLDGDTLQVLEDINQACNTYQKFDPKACQFQG